MIGALDGGAGDLDRTAGIVPGRYRDDFGRGHIYCAVGEALPQTELLPDHFDGHVFGLNVLRRPSHGTATIAANRPKEVRVVQRRNEGGRRLLHSRDALGNGISFLLQRVNYRSKDCLALRRGNR